jgi:hypothetical protein
MLSEDSYVLSYPYLLNYFAGKEMTAQQRNA